MRIGLVIDGTDGFVRPIEIELRRRHELKRFTPRFVRLPLIGQRVNERLLETQLQAFIRQNDVTFFEWAASLLVTASHLPKQGRIVTRLHSVELATAAEQVEWSNVDHLVVLNETSLTRLRKLVNQPLPPTSVIANGVSLMQFRPQPHVFGYKLGMVGSLLPIKRIYEVVLAVYQLRQEGHPFTLHIAGEPGEGEFKRYLWALESLIESLGLAQAVHFYGHVAEVGGWLQNIDVFVSNSYWEGQQVALIEAMASGCNCLGHCWKGIEEILPTENIYTTDGDLRAKLIAYATLSEAAQQAAQAQMRAIAEERFDERRMVREIVELIEQVTRT